MNHDNALKIMLAQPRFRQAIANHARSNPETDPVRRVHQAVSSIAPRLADRAAQHAQSTLGAHQSSEAGDERDKVSKASVDYRPGSVARHCGNCSMYRDHACTLVRGVIDPSATCKKWEAQAASPKPKEPSTDRAASQTIRAPAHVLKNARQAPDGNHYIPDPSRPGKYLMVVNSTAMGLHPAAPHAQGNVRDIDLIRHGSTDLNSNDTSVDRIRGHKDVPLNAEGKAQAAVVGEDIAKSPNKPDVLVSSDLCRAKLTAQIIHEKTGIPLAWISENFRPWDAGELTGQKSSKAVPIMAQYAEHRPDEKLPGGESFHTFLGRLFIGIDEALRRHPNGKIGIVSHHRDERALQSWAAKGFPPDGSIDIKTFNQKGENTGSAQTIRLPVDRVRVVAQRYRNAAMASKNIPKSEDRPGQE